MRKIVLLLLVVCLGTLVYAEGQEFRWARVKFNCKESDAQERWDIDKKGDETFLENVQKYTTLKVDKTWNNVTLTKLDSMIKFPLLFMTASGTPDLSPKEISNLKEYLNRGGFLLCDDSNWPERGGNIFVDGMRKILDQMYPGRKVVPLELGHDLLRAPFDIPLGYYVKLSFEGEKSPSGVWAISDDKGRPMVFFTLLLQNTWGGVYYHPEKQEDAIKMGINIVMYSLTH